MEWITIQIYTYPHEAYIAQSKLESEGIETFLKDELTTQIYSFYSNAIGGVKLQVHKENEMRAKQILDIIDYSNSRTEEEIQNFATLQKISKKIPIVKNLGFELRIFITLIFVITAIVLCFVGISFFLENIK